MKRRSFPASQIGKPVPERTKRGPTLPSPDKPMPKHAGNDDLRALELRIEQAWLELTTMHASRSRTYWLTGRGHLIHGYKASNNIHAEELGTFTRAEDFAHFRETVFWLWDRMHGGRHG